MDLFELILLVFIAFLVLVAGVFRANDVARRNLTTACYKLDLEVECNKLFGELPPGWEWKSLDVGDTSQSD